ncbi:hypothetical protein [Streptomyces sp. URMC 123]|uniref:hypothetical protein n=1 Tax=Streptomyces sp. URMC 123 TaxID=3423403 RepID=UPI003F1ADE21
MTKAAAARDAAVGRSRAARDTRNARSLAAKRSAVRKAPARRRARRALWRSAARMQGRRLLAAALGGAVGLAGLVSTPLGRRLGLPGLMHPGRRLYRRLMGQARTDRDARDTAIRERRRAEEAAADSAAAGDRLEVRDRVERPRGLAPCTSTTTSKEVMHVSGFRFEEAAAEMESAARTYDPDDGMEILAMVENLPEALTSIASTFRILAERSDREFPMEKAVADGFDDIHRTLLAAVDAAADLGPLFRRVHEPDIARHEDPRNGPEAEKKWNV